LLQSGFAMTIKTIEIIEEAVVEIGNHENPGA
jgi:hypothetical protein